MAEHATESTPDIDLEAGMMDSRQKETSIHLFKQLLGNDFPDYQDNLHAMMDILSVDGVLKKMDVLETELREAGQDKQRRHAVMAKATDPFAK